MAKAVFGITKSESQAIAIADQLRAAGFSENDISVLLPDRGPRISRTSNIRETPEGAAAGATAGAVLGGALGWMTSIGALPSRPRSLYRGRSTDGSLGGAAGGAAARGSQESLMVWGFAREAQLFTVWGFPNTRRSDTRVKSKAATSCSQSTLRTAMSENAPKKSSSREGQKISLIQKRVQSEQKILRYSRFFNLTNHFFIFRCKIRCERAHFEPNVLLRQSTGPSDDHSTIQPQ